MPACVDASFVLARLLPDERGEPVLGMWQRLLDENMLVAPPLMWAEVTSGLRRASRSGRLPSSDAIEAVGALLRFPVRMVTDLTIYPRALALAEHLDLRNTYDAQYLAVAELGNWPLVTLDQGLYQNARNLGIEARLLP